MENGLIVLKERIDFYVLCDGCQLFVHVYSASHEVEFLRFQITKALNVGLAKKTYIYITFALSLWILFYCYQNNTYTSSKVVPELTERKGRSKFNVTGTVKIPWANKFTWTNESNWAADHKIMTEDSGKNDGIISLDPYPLLKYNHYSAPLYTMAPTLRMEVTVDRNAVVNKTVGRIQVSKRVPTWQELETKYVTWNKALLEEALKISVLSEWKSKPLVKLLLQEDTLSAGPWRPVDCRPNETVAIILPYRDRELQLRTFLYHMHGFLRHQEVTYTIFVVEQLDRTHFNRGSLLNIGFRESKRVAEFDCFIFHDADLLPEDDRLPYRCRDQPIHLSASLDIHNHTLLYQGLVGGATAFSRTQFEKVRGFSNFFFGWGGEDDNLYNRLKEKGYQVYRYPLNISRYTMLRHEREQLNQPNPIRHELLKHMMGRSKLDGYPESDYKVVDAGYKHKGLVYWISVEIPEKKVENKFLRLFPVNASALRHFKNQSEVKAN